MSFDFLKWLHSIIASFHDRLTALEAHHGIASTQPEMHPDVAGAVHPAEAPKDGQAASLAGFLSGGGHVQEEGVQTDHTGFDFGPVPSGNPKRNALEGGKSYTYSFSVLNPTKLRIVVADDNTVGKPAFDNFSLTIKQNGQQVMEPINQPSNTSASYIETPELHGSYTMDFSVDKTALVSLQCGQG